MTALVTWFGKGLADRFFVRFPWQGMALAVVAALWLCLFWNNLLSLRSFLGFDSLAHVDYVDYIQKHGALPLADEGFEMYHPPLYYLVSAVVLKCCGLSVSDEAAVGVLQFLSLLLGTAQIVLIFASLRLVFPNRSGPQQTGLVLAAFTPVQLYMFQFVGNEPLFSVLGAGAIYLALRMLKDDKHRIRLPLALGFCLARALLTKITALLLIVVIAGTLAAQLVVQRRYAPRAWLRTLGAPLLVCLAVSGWHYARVWARFGTPLVNNVSKEFGFGHWDAPGYSNAEYFLRFGRSLQSPFFSVLYSFADGAYSTLWGDGVWGGERGGHGGRLGTTTSWPPAISWRSSPPSLFLSARLQPWCGSFASRARSGSCSWGWPFPWSGPQSVCISFRRPILP